MSDQESPGEATAVEAVHPRWSVWRSDAGQWWAAVRANLTCAQERAGCVPYLSAIDLPELETLLAAEDERAGTTAERS